MSHEERVEAAKTAIEKVFSDRSVSKAKTKESLEELQELIEVMIDAVVLSPRE